MTSSPTSIPEPQRLTTTHWLICIVAAIGFAFDTYELLMAPLVAPSALARLLGADPFTAAGNAEITAWFRNIQMASGLSGGFFGLIGGYLTDRFGRRRVLVWSILLYAFSAFAAGFATNVWMLLILRCTTFIGVCVEFVAAVAWLAELFPNPKQREMVLGYTQAFSSVGGLMVTAAFAFSNRFAEVLPAIHGEHAAWRYTLISGLIPAIPLMLIRPFLPESPSWQMKREQGTLRRPRFSELFAPSLRRTTIVTAIMFACTLGTAFGTIQFAPQIVPGLVEGVSRLGKLRADYEKLDKSSPEAIAMRTEMVALNKARLDNVATVNGYQEIGGLVGRFALAALAVVILGRRKLLWVFQIPGLIVIPLVFMFPATNNLSLFAWGMFIAGFFTISQLSFWGNYLPRVYPVHLRGTGESFAANVGGRMIGTCVVFVTTALIPVFAKAYPESAPHVHVAYAAAVVAVLTYGISFIASFFLPEPPAGELAD